MEGPCCNSALENRKGRQLSYGTEISERTLLQRIECSTNRVQKTEKDDRSHA